jgi:hypothetical protein
LSSPRGVTVEVTMSYEEFKAWQEKKMATCHDESNDLKVEDIALDMR